MKTGKKVAALLMAVLVLAAAIPMAAFAADEGDLKDLFAVTVPRGIIADPTEAEEDGEVLLTIVEGFELKKDTEIVVTADTDEDEDAEDAEDAEEGDEAAEITLTEGKEKNTFTFKMPAADVTVTAEFGKEADKFTEAKMKSFSVDDAAGTINEKEGTITLNLRKGADIEDLEPVFEISTYAEVADVDFADKAVYKVTSEDGKTTKDYKVVIVYRLLPADTGVDEILETEKHSFYMEGDKVEGSDAKTFRPDSDITRKEVVSIFNSLLQDQKLAENEKAVEFEDVDYDDDKLWYADALKKISAMGVVEGYEDGTFLPDKAITRAEFVTIASKFITEKGVEGEWDFKDIPEDAWYEEFMDKVMGASWIVGDENGDFRPQANIKRAEVVSIVNKMLDREADRKFIDANKDDLVQFSDLKTDHWGYYAIREATNSHEFDVTLGGESWTKLVTADDKDDDKDTDDKDTDDKDTDDKDTDDKDTDDKDTDDKDTDDTDTGDEGTDGDE